MSEDRFQFTEKQQEIVDYVLEQATLGENGKNIVVTGIGGTGKTSLVCELACILLEKGYRVAAGCMTGKATGVLRKKIYENLSKHDLVPADSSLKIETISKITKKSKVLGNNVNGETLYSNIWINPQTFEYDVLIIDELSMVPSYLSLWWQKTKCLVIGLGDFCQIPEVTTEETKKEISSFRHDLKLPSTHLISGYGIKVLKNLATFHLTEVLRSTGDITLCCNDLRDFSMTKNQIKDTLKKWAVKSPNIEYSTNLEDLETDEDWQIIAYTNKLCQQINDALAIGSDYPDPEDKVLLFDNLNPIQCYNGEIYKFKDLIKKVETNNMTSQHPIYIVWKFNNKMPRKNSKYPIEQISYYNWINYSHQAKLRNSQKIQSVFTTIKNLNFISEEQKQTYINEIQDLQRTILDCGQCFSEIVQRFEDIDLDIAREIVAKAPESPLVYFVNIGMGYCCTTHKSQGSEYNKVCYILERMDKPLLYTGCSRAKEKLKVIDLTK